MDTAVIDAIIAFLTGAFGPTMLVVFAVIGIFRAIFKPLMALIAAIVAVTPSKSDDELLAKVEGNKWYAMFVWLIDYLTSVKLPK
jgi:hypothetical protein